MDSALKQRLIGAIVLVVLAVIFLPMVFDGTSSTTEQAVDLTIPAAPDREFETRMVPLTPQSPTSPAAVIGGEADPNAIVTVDADVTKPADAMAGTDMAPEVEPLQPPEFGGPAATSAATPGSPAAAPSNSAASGPSTAPNTPAGATANAATAGASSVPSPAPTAAPQPDGRGRYAVSFGSYSKRENAEALVASLKKGGIPAYADEVTVDGKPALRVRAGPYVDRGAADETRLLAKRVRSDVTGNVVEIDDSAPAPAASSGANAPASSAAPAPTAAASLTGWAVQIAAFKTEADAAAQRDKLRGGGFAAFVDPVRTEEGTLYRVRVGPEATKASAQKLADSVKARFALQGIVVTHP